MAYILLTYLLFAYTVQQVYNSPDNLPSTKRRHLILFLLSGLVAGLAINAKLIALLSLGGIGVIWLKLVWQRRVNLKQSLALVFGTLTIPALWELIQLVVIKRLTNFDMYRRHLQERIRFIADDGSGFGAQDHNGLEFLWEKALIISEISHSQEFFSLLTLLLVAAGGLVLSWLYRRNQVQQNWILLLWVGWLGRLTPT